MCRTCIICGTGLFHIMKWVSLSPPSSSSSLPLHPLPVLILISLIQTQLWDDPFEPTKHSDTWKSTISTTVSKGNNSSNYQMILLGQPGYDTWILGQKQQQQQQQQNHQQQQLPNDLIRPTRDSDTWSLILCSTSSDDIKGLRLYFIGAKTTVFIKPSGNPWWPAESNHQIPKGSLVQ